MNRLLPSFVVVAPFAASGAQAQTVRTERNMSLEQDQGRAEVKCWSS